MTTNANGAVYARSQKLGVLRLALTGTLAAATFYLLCWIGAQLPVGPAPHMYLRLFTTAELSSGAALAEGLSWSIAFGLIAGALLALIYNALGFLDRR